MKPHQQVLLSKLAVAWEHIPNARLGQLIESVEEVGWDILPQRHCSMRLCNMSDQLFEQAMDRWNGMGEVRKVVSS